MRSFDASKIAIFGDWHGNLTFAVTALHQLYMTERPDLYLHVGDFGFWPVDNEEAWMPEYLPGLERLLEAQDRTLLFIDGNHEHFTWLHSLPVDDDGLRKISDHIYHLPRGEAIMAGGKKIVGLGGACSIDRGLRTKDYSWFDEELITTEDLQKTLSNRQTDILLTHEAPMLNTSGGTGSYELDQLTAKQRSFVAEAAVGLEAKLLVHGHHHRAYIDDYRGTQVIGLGCDDMELTLRSVELNHVLVELDEL